MKIPVDQLKVGTSLAMDVMSPTGQLLLKAGVAVTDKHIRAFKMWGVTEVELDGGGDLPQSSFSPEILEKADKALHDRFYGADLSNPVLNRIFAFCLNRLASKISKNSEAS